MRKLRSRAGKHFAQVTQVVISRTPPRIQLFGSQRWNQRHLGSLGTQRQGRPVRSPEEEVRQEAAPSEGQGEAGAVGVQDSPESESRRWTLLFGVSTPAAQRHQAVGKPWGLLSEKQASSFPIAWPLSPFLFLLIFLSQLLHCSFPLPNFPKVTVGLGLRPVLRPELRTLLGSSSLLLLS